VTCGKAISHPYNDLNKISDLPHVVCASWECSNRTVPSKPANGNYGKNRLNKSPMCRVFIKGKWGLLYRMKLKKHYMIKLPKKQLKTYPYYLIEVVTNLITSDGQISKKDFKAKLAENLKSLSPFSRMFYISTNCIFPYEDKSILLNYDFWMGQFPVTIYEYFTFCNLTGTKKPNSTQNQYNNQPFFIVGLSQKQMKDYCNWLSQNEGLSPAYDKDGELINRKGKRTQRIETVEGYRLPTFDEYGFINSAVYYYCDERNDYRFHHYFSSMSAGERAKALSHMFKQGKIIFFDRYETCLNKCVHTEYQNKNRKKRKAWDNWQYLRIHTFDQIKMQSQNYINYTGPKTGKVYYKVSLPFKNDKYSIKIHYDSDLIVEYYYRDNSPAFRIARTAMKACVKHE